MADKLGIVAGRGDLPRQIIAACRAQGRPFFVVAVEDHADPETVADAPHAWVRLGAAGLALKRLRDEGVKEIVLAGGISRPSLSGLRPDWWAAKFLARSGAAVLGDDGLLSALVRDLETREGFRVVGIPELLPGSLAPPGTWGRVVPDDTAWQDIRKGLRVVRVLGAVDVGQAAVVQQGLVLGVEAVEGTDRLLERCGSLRREGPGGVLIKARKPGQENRADLPTIGERTVRHAAAAGLRGIAVEAGGALVTDRDAVVKAADALGLFVVAAEVEPESP